MLLFCRGIFFEYPQKVLYFFAPLREIKDAGGV